MPRLVRLPHVLQRSSQGLDRAFFVRDLFLQRIYSTHSPFSVAPETISREYSDGAGPKDNGQYLDDQWWRPNRSDYRESRRKNRARPKQMDQDLGSVRNKHAPGLLLLDLHLWIIGRQKGSLRVSTQHRVAL